MSGLEIVAFILGTTGPLQQSFQLIDVIKQHHRAYKSNPQIVDGISESLKKHEEKLKDLNNQLNQYQTYIRDSNQQFIKETLKDIQNMIVSTSSDLEKLKTDLGKSKIKRGWKARSSLTTCKNIESQLEKSNSKLQEINNVITDISSNISITTAQAGRIMTQMETNQDQIVNQISQINIGSSSDSHPPNKYIPLRQSLQYSNAAMINFHEKDHDEKFVSMEGKIKHKLLNSSHPGQNILAIQGEAGVGKTTTLGMLTQNDEIRDYFIDGVYCMKLGADANNKTVMEEIIKIVEACGGRQLSEEMNQMDTMYKVIEKACEWFKDKQVLFAIDDIWYKNGNGVEIVQELSKLVRSGKNAAMVYTTRDPSVALRGSAFKLSRRDVLSSESRSILMGHAQYHDRAGFDRDTENAIQYLLKVCNGLPAAHGVVGKAVGQYALSCRNGFSQAWKWYQQTHGSIVESNGDEYGNLSSVFRTALKILDEEDKRNEENNGIDCYSFSKMHRGLCVLEKQQRVPISMLECLWSIEGEEDSSSMSKVRHICEKFISVGLAEWNPTTRSTRGNNKLNDNDDDDSNEITECISIHDLLHDFSLNEAKKNGEVEEWHDRVLNGYKRKYNIRMNENAKCEEWWKIENMNEDKDGYFLKNVCRQMKSITNRRSEIVNLVTRPEWITAQVCTNGIIQYGEDVKYATECIDNNTEEIDIRRDDKLSIADIECIHEAVRLSTAYILRNRGEIVFQLYDRLIRKASESTSLNRYLLYMRNNAPEVWIRPLLPCLSGVGSKSIFIGKSIECMVALKGEEEVACGCGDGDIVIVNMKNKYIKRSWNAHEDWVCDMKLSEDGKYLISGSIDKTAKVWDAETFELKRVLEGHTEELGAVWIGNGGNTAFTGSLDGTVRRWDVDSGEDMGEYCSVGERIDYLAVLEDGKVVIFAGDGKEILYRVRMESEEDRRNNGSPSTRIFSKSTEKKVKIKDEISAFAMSKDETKVAIATDENRIIICNTTTLNEIQTIDINDSIRGRSDYIAWSNDGTRLICASFDGDILIIDVNCGEMIFEPLKTNFYNPGFEWIDDGNKVVFCSLDGMIKWWKVGDISSQASTSDQNRLNCRSVAIAPDGSDFVTGHEDGILRIWDAATASLKQSEQICDSTILAVTVSPDGTRIFCGCDDGTLQVVDKSNLLRITSFKGHNDAIICIDISVDGNHLVTGSDDKTIRIWDEKCDGSHSTINIGSSIDQVFICEDGKRIFCETYDDDFNDKIQVWDIEKKQCIREKEFNERPRSRNEAMILIDEMEQDKTATSRTLFCDSIGKEIKYGLFDNYEVLATLEFPIIKWEYDMKHQILCVLNWKGEILFLKLKEIWRTNLCTNSSENSSTNASSNAPLIHFSKHYNFGQMSSS